VVHIENRFVLFLCFLFTLISFNACGRKSLRIVAADDNPTVISCLPKTENGVQVGENCSTFWPIENPERAVLNDDPTVYNDPRPYYEYGTSGQCQVCSNTPAGIQCSSVDASYCVSIPKEPTKEDDKDVVKEELDPWEMVIDTVSQPPVTQTGSISAGGCIAAKTSQGKWGVACDGKSVFLQGEPDEIVKLKDDTKKNGTHKIKIVNTDGSTAKVVEKDNGRVKIKVVAADGTKNKVVQKKDGTVKVK